VLLLIAMLSTAVASNRYLDSITEEISFHVSAAAAAAKAGEWESAEASAEMAAEKWKASDGYTHVVLRHAEIDTVSASIFELVEKVQSQDEGGVTGAANAAEYYLDSIARMERVRLGSIF